MIVKPKDLLHRTTKMVSGDITTSSLDDQVVERLSRWDEQPFLSA